MQITIGDTIKRTLLNTRLYVLGFECTIENSEKELWDEITNYTDVLKINLVLEGVNQIETIAAARNAYKKCGKDPSRYRPSAESLIRRIVKGNSLYKVNNVVDILNFISIQSGISIGGYDTDKITGNVVMDIGTAEDYYTGIGRGELNIEGLPILRDNLGVFGSPTSDSERTMITFDTKNAAFVFFDFGNSEHIENYINRTIKYLKAYSKAGNISENTFLV